MESESPKISEIEVMQNWNNQNQKRLASGHMILIDDTDIL
jgi:hypothetical protein